MSELGTFVTLYDADGSFRTEAARWIQARATVMVSHDATGRIRRVDRTGVVALHA